ncbi:MAG: hypothetical protein WA584_09885 [Pyrinomonadaceae bacterium]
MFEKSDFSRRKAPKIEALLLLYNDLTIPGEEVASPPSDCRNPVRFRPSKSYPKSIPKPVFYKIIL